MAGLESRLTIRAVDETAKAFADVEKRINVLEQAALRLEKIFGAMSKITNEASLFKGIAQREEIDAAVSSMERLIGMTEKAAAAQRTLAQSAKTAGGALASEARVGAAGMERVGSDARRAAGAARGRGHAPPVIVPSGGSGIIEQAKGFLPFFAAYETFEIAKKAVENTAELEQTRFRVRELSRNDPSEAPFADKLASEIAAKYPSITTGKALDTYTELRANAVDLQGRIDPAIARRNMMAAARAQNAALALGFEMTPTDMQNLLKGVEGSGRANDPKAVEKISDAYIRAKQVFGSAIASNMIRDYTANAKAANFSIGDDQFYLSNMVRMSEGNASRLGNEVNQTLATMVGGHMTKATGAWMVAHGLAQAGQIVKTGPGTVSIKGGLKDEATLQTDQGRWAATTLRKAIEESGAISEDKVSARAELLKAQELKRNPNAEIDARFLRERAEEGLLAAEIAKTGMRSSVTDNLAHFIGNQRLIERDVAALQNASGTAASDRLSQNPVAAFHELTASLSNFGTALADPGISAAGPILHGLAQGITSLTTSLLAAEAALGKGGRWLFSGDGKVPGNSEDAGYRASLAYIRQNDMHPMIRGERDMEGARAGALSRLIEGGHAATPIQVDSTVHGEATLTSKVEVTASSTLLSIVQRAESVTTQVPLNPVQGGHSGRMDSDAAPLTWSDKLAPHVLGTGGVGHR